ncbi:transcription factor IIIC subunit delta amino-terminal protein [Ceratobasidium sp. AG-Ba]|nr:transcription factor IIIC subunit delta amino-terminal protein [Ceratobasidium sp. AG-Ba]QRW03114.1 transcription factor IIIC subunit delta amino-terminal protein [Ceratobasidium sp. AG-Ba]
MVDAPGWPTASAASPFIWALLMVSNSDHDTIAMSLLSTLSLNDAPINSSVDTLQCSGDGQIAVVTRSVVYVVTPNFDTKTESNPGNIEPNSSTGAFTWFRTAVHDVDKARAWAEHNEGSELWNLHGKQLHGLPAGSTNLEVTLTNNMEVFVWAPVKNPLNGKWIKIQNITEDQISAYDQENLMLTDDVLRCQTCSIAWSSSNREDDLSSPLDAKSSLLALGSRFGDLNLFYWDSDMHKARHCLTCHVEEAWVTSLAWSQWKPVDAGNSGEHGISCMRPNAEEPYSAFKLPKVIEADARSITAMTFAVTCGDLQLQLAVAKPGFVQLYRQSGLSDSQTPEGTSLQTVLLSVARTSLGSTPIATCTGLYYLSEDRLVVILAEGSFNVVADASGMAHLEDDNNKPDRMIGYCDNRVMRRLTEAAEEGPLNQAEYARIYGVRPIGSGRHIVWTQMVLQPYDLSFRVQANFRTRVCVAKLWDQETDSNSRIVSLVNAVQQKPKSIAYSSPTALLREVVFETLDSALITLVAPRILPLLAPDWEPATSDESQVIGPAGTGMPYLFVHRTRMKFSLALFILNRSGLPDELVKMFRAVHDKLLELLAALNTYNRFDQIIAEDNVGDLGMDMHIFKFVLLYALFV